MIERLFAATVATAETHEELIDVALFPEEERALGRAVQKRRYEFTTGRACARIALGKLGVSPVAIASGERGEPLWPAGIVGSITHCAGYRACAVARAADVASLGIDAEPNGPLPDGVTERVAFGAERELLAAAGGPVPTDAGDGEVWLDRLLFSAKEAVYKAWFPLARRWLGFEDVELSIDVARGRFDARLLVAGPLVGGAPLRALAGTWAAEGGVLCAAVSLPGPDGAGSGARGERSVTPEEP